MRLTEEQATLICTNARATFGRDAVVRLFGSRTDPARRGGDIDLAIEISGPLPGFVQRSQFLTGIDAVSDSAKVDLIFLRSGQTTTGFEAIVRRDGVVLS